MADITNPQAVRFSNEDIRPMADKLAQAYYAAKVFLNEWSAQGIGTLIPNTNDVIMDGSDTDGRAAIDGAKINGLQGYLATFVADLEANGNLKLNVLLQIAVNPDR
jgi:hypothetical protein